MSNRAGFFELIARVNAVEDRHHEVLPDINAQLLLMRVAMAHHAGSSMNVTQAMNLAHIGSPAMLHRKINDLLNQGLIELTFEGNNRRTKFWCPQTKPTPSLTSWPMPPPRSMRPSTDQR